jgi:uncharacterized membrane protein
MLAFDLIFEALWVLPIEPARTAARDNSMAVSGVVMNGPIAACQSAA